MILIRDLTEFAGIIDMSLDWQYMISAKTIGGTDLLSTLSKKDSPSRATIASNPEYMAAILKKRPLHRLATEEET